MLRCTLKVASDTVEVAGKTWGSEDTFEPPADAPHQALARALVGLRAKLPPPAER